MQKEKMMTTRTLLSAALVMALALTGCGDDKAKSPSQVLARVNDKEITVLQLNYLLAQNQNLPKEQQRSKQALLDELIQQELLVQIATEKKLDRNPNVLQAMEFAKRQVLAQAAAGQEMASIKEPGETELKAFYQANPQLFAERQVYSLAAFLVKADALTPEVATALNDSTSDEQTASILKEHGINFTSTRTTTPAEALPEDVTKQLTKINIGDIVQVKEAGNLVMMQLKGRTPAPMSYEQSRQAILQHLKQGKLQSEGSQKLDQLKQQAKIEYLQKFDEEAAAAAKEATTSPSAAQGSQAAGDDHLKSGLKGLK